MAKRSKGLSTRHKLFALEFLANGRNATAAYRSAYPSCRTDRACEVNGSRLLRKAEVSEFIDARTVKVVEQMEYTADKAIADIGRSAQVDIRKLFDTEGKLLPISKWPDDVADAVKSITPTEFGFRVALVDKLSARITIAKAAGKFAKKDSKRDRVTLGQLLGDGPLPDKG